MPQKVAIYARVSTDEQSTDNQLPFLEKWVTERGHVLVATYTENESGWRAGHQRELARLFSELPKTGAQICLVWALDRLTREGIQRIFEIVERFKKNGVQVISLQESWTEQDGPMRELMMAIVSWLAQFDSKRKSERVKAGLARRKSQGLPVGRQKGSKDNGKRRTTGYHLRHNPELKERYG